MLQKNIGKLHSLYIDVKNMAKREISKALLNSTRLLCSQVFRIYETDNVNTEAIMSVVARIDSITKDLSNINT